MKILVYCDSLSPSGGLERVVCSHINFFSRSHDVSVIVKDDGNSFYKLPLDIRIISFNNNINFAKFTVLDKLVNSISSILKFNRVTKNSEFDYVYVPTPLNFIEVILANIRPSKIIITNHASYNGYNKFYKLVIKFFYRFAKIIILPTKYDFDIYSRFSKTIKFIPYSKPFSTNYLANPDAKIALCVGRLTLDKQHHLLIDIWSEIAKFYPDWKLRIVGSGELNDDLINTIQRHNLSSSVTIVKPTKNIMSEYFNASIFLLTSRFEGFGMVLIEAMECGLPCVSFDCPSGPPEIITNGLNGFLIRSFDLVAYSNKVKLLIQDPELRNFMAIQAKSSASQYSEKVIFDHWEKLLSTL